MKVESYEYEDEQSRKIKVSVRRACFGAWVAFGQKVNPVGQTVVRPVVFIDRVKDLARVLP